MTDIGWLRLNLPLLFIKVNGKPIIKEVLSSCEVCYVKKFAEDDKLSTWFKIYQRKFVPSQYLAE